MYQSTIILSLLAALVAGAPAPVADTNSVAPPGTYINYGLSSLDDTDDSLAKRTYINYGISDDDSTPEGDNLVKRKSNYISSCGDEWIWVEDDKDEKYMGYNTAVDAWCYHITHSQDGTESKIAARQKLAGLIQDGYQLSHGGAASVEFEIHNKKEDGMITVVEEDCKTNLKQMSAVGAKAANGEACWGSGKGDTKGGTYQVGNDEVSYHALPGGPK